MKFGVVVFPGSNCDMDMVYVLETIMKQEVVKLWHKDTRNKFVFHQILIMILGIGYHTHFIF